MYKLDHRFAEADHGFTVTVVGCGGTGGFVAEGLCRLLPEKARLVVIDHDRVEERNLIRQNFGYDDLDKYKSEALAHRLAKRYGRPVSYSTLPIAAVEIGLPGLVIGCVDNGYARGDIAHSVEELIPPYGYNSWWIDAGNGENYGQVLVGNHPEISVFVRKSEECVVLPLPTVQRPELLLQVPREPSCAQMDEQGPTINQAIAAVTVEMARRIIEGTCSWMQLYLDLEAGTLYPVLATPEAARRIGKCKIFKERR